MFMMKLKKMIASSGRRVKRYPISNIISKISFRGPSSRVSKMERKVISIAARYALITKRSEIRSRTNRQSIQIYASKMLLTRQKIAGILCVFQDFLTQSAAFWAAKMGAGAIGTASNSVLCPVPLLSFRFFV
ncbi:MAG: hypothetical protein J1E06_00665 [Acutalibacter sp.]|nr:hypothetical protein [Acutalibacter sp.]